jgi:hypothetical protein
VPGELSRANVHFGIEWEEARFELKKKLFDSVRNSQSSQRN